jgi:hypothetical protein
MQSRLKIPIHTTLGKKRAQMLPTWVEGARQEAALGKLGQSLDAVYHRVIHVDRKRIRRTCGSTIQTASMAGAPRSRQTVLNCTGGMIARCPARRRLAAYPPKSLQHFLANVGRKCPSVIVMLSHGFRWPYLSRNVFRHRPGHHSALDESIKDESEKWQK